MSLNYIDPNVYSWPDDKRRAVAPVRVGVDRKTGKMLMGEKHEDQSIGAIFTTRYHDRVLRRWVGSFVPHLLGETISERLLGRFFWAVIVSLDLWEPNYKVQRVLLSDRPDGTAMTTAKSIRSGNVAFRADGVRVPRGHLGDHSEEVRRGIGISGGRNWSVTG